MPESTLWCLSTTEVYPFSKIGGLGDYCYSFAKGLRDRGHEVMVFSPYYEKHMLPLTAELDYQIEPRTITFRKRELSYLSMSCTYEGITYVFFRYAPFWGHDTMFLDDCKRYNENLNGSTLLGKAMSIELRIRLQAESGNRRLVVQGNDALSSFFAPYIQAEAFPNVQVTKLYAVHSFVGEAVGRIYRMDEYYLDQEFKALIDRDFSREKSWLEVLTPHFDRFITVSPNYVTEITSGETSLSKLFSRMHQEGRLAGFLNGIDDAFWSIHSSPLLGREEGDTLSALKHRYKAKLCRRIGLSLEKPLLVFVGRITPQKGLQRLNDMLALLPDSHIVILGQGEPLEHYITEPYRKQVTHFDHYEEQLCHEVLAAADYSIVPSEYEPCGYVAMYAPRFGVIPLVRETGGLVNIAASVESVLQVPILFDTADQFARLYSGLLVRNLHESDTLREKLSHLTWRWDETLEQMELFVLSHT